MTPADKGNMALLSHEYVHVLQYRKLGFSFLRQYVEEGGFYNWDYPLEQQGMDIQDLYERNLSLPLLWMFPY